MVVDAGNFSIHTRRIKEVDLPIQRRKVELILDGFKAAPLSLQAIGIGERDLLMGGAWLVEQLNTRGLPHVVSNLSCDGIPFVDSRTHRIGGTTIEFLSFISPSMLESKTVGEQIAVTDMLPGCTMTTPSEWLAEHPRKSDIRIAFADLNRNELETLEPYVDIVIESKMGKTTASPEQMDTNTVLIGVGSKGKNLGHLSWQQASGKSGFASGDAKSSKERDLKRRYTRLQQLEQQILATEDGSPDQNKLQRQIDYTQRSIAQLEAEIGAIPVTDASVTQLTQKLVPLNRSIDNDDAIEQLIATAQTDIETLEQSIAIEPYVGPYVGSESCKTCHADVYSSWSQTSHAHAWKTLVAAGREMDPSCFSCHSTGGGWEGGPERPNQVGHLKNVGCESCHGPGQEHVAQNGAGSIEKEVTMSVCTKCHNGIQDNGEFEPVSYWERILHDIK